jgi:hypothetical protein
MYLPPPTHPLLMLLLGFRGYYHYIGNPAYKTVEQSYATNSLRPHACKHLSLMYVGGSEKEIGMYFDPKALS